MDILISHLIYKHILIKVLKKKMFKYKKIVTSFGIFDQLRVSKSDNNHRNRSSQNKTIHNRKNNTKIKANCIQVKIKISYICM